MSRNLSVTEPHPSVPQKGGYIGGGRGGAGNFKKYNSSELTSGPNATGPASRTPLNLSRPAGPQRILTAGRGGAGNLFRPSTKDESAIFKFDEELVKERDHQAPVYYVGRGGAANFVDESKPQRIERMRSEDSSSGASVSSRSSNGSVRSAWSKMTRRITRE